MENEPQKRRNIFVRSLNFTDVAISRFEGFVLASGVILMAINTMAGAISRFVFNDAIIVTDELNMFFIVMITFAGISYAAREGRHIRMSAIYDALPVKIRKIFIIVISAITAFFMFFLCYYSVVYIVDIYESGRILPALEVPVYLVYLWVPVGFFVTGIQYIFTVIKNFTDSNVYLSMKVLDGYSDIDSQKEV